MRYKKFQESKKNLMLKRYQSERQPIINIKRAKTNEKCLQSNPNLNILDTWTVGGDS